MKWFNGMAVALAVTVLASAALAESIPDQMVRYLQGQGYLQITVSRTFLGRTRIVAVNGGITREIILDPRSGEILRDLSRRANGAVIVGDFEGSDHADATDTPASGDDRSGDSGHGTDVPDSGPGDTGPDDPDPDDTGPDDSGNDDAGDDGHGDSSQEDGGGNDHGSGAGDKADLDGH